MTGAAAATSNGAEHQAARSQGGANGARGPVASYTDEPHAPWSTQAFVAGGNQNGTGQERGPAGQSAHSGANSSSPTQQAPATPNTASAAESSRQASQAQPPAANAAALPARESGSGSEQAQMQLPGNGNSSNAAPAASDRPEASKQQVAGAPEIGTTPNTALAPKPVAILPVTITVEADPLFDFDKAAIRPDSQTKLEQLARGLKGLNYGDIVAVGYADPIGTAFYNQELSQRRAAAVKAYLTGLGIATNKIETEGRGETEEFANYQACGGLRNEKTIACLQPDRRVEVTVNARKQN